MIEKNKQYPARIEGYTSEGLGVARIDGQAVFVHRALRGEEGDVLVLKVLKNVAFGKFAVRRETSPHRTEPDCPYYGRCGGCDFRHMDRAEELEAKRQRVQDALRRIGGCDVAVESILTDGEAARYRNKSQYTVAADGTVGFYRPRTHQVVEVAQCRLQKEQADAAAAALRRYIKAYDVPCYDETTRRGLLRHLYVRTNGAGQSLLCVLVNGQALPHEAELVALLREAVPDAVGVVLGVNTKSDGAVLGEVYRTLWGEDTLTDELCGLTFRLSVPSFFQVNRPMAEVLYETALEFAALTGKELVLDLYCGAGTITQVMARRAKEAIGAEIVPEAIRNAKENARRREHGLLLRRRLGGGGGHGTSRAAPRRDLRRSAAQGACPGGGGRGGGYGAASHRLRLLRPGDAGAGRQAVRREGLPGHTRGGGGYVPEDGECGDGMPFVQTSRSKASCECDCGYG